ncbi:fumarylacetoacetate hydrolase family protein [Pendulispora rubella]|uniref:Fumarylacetoacetate hydrolase family protein n=1 Tax=Pendulispora rubella TaxID=2741070 RepID=A0ABZ2KQI2_9BACT
MPNTDPGALARELLAAYETGAVVPSTPSARDDAFDLRAGYAVEAELLRARQSAGRKSTGLKVGYANKAVWRALKLDTLVWAHMYDDTVHFTDAASTSLTLPYYRSPKIEPEIVIKLREPVPAGLEAAADVLPRVEWVALGFEIIDCPFPDWTFKPADFVAAFGLHLALVVGPPLRVEAGAIPALVESLASFKLTLSKGDQLVEKGAGKNSLRSPALCVAELASALSRAGSTPLAAGELISTGTLTTGQSVAKGETWRAEVEGLDLPSLSLRFE